MNINTIHNNTIFDFMFGTVPQEQLTDVQEAIYLIFLLVLADVVSRVLAESVKYNRFVGRKVTPINILTGLWHSLWPMDVEGREDPVRLLFSTRFRAGLWYKVCLYPALLTISLWVTKLPHNPFLFGIHLDTSISSGLMATPAFMELYSIGENFIEIDKRLFKKLDL